MEFWKWWWNRYIKRNLPTKEDIGCWFIGLIYMAIMLLEVYLFHTYFTSIPLLGFVALLFIHSFIDDNKKMREAYHNHHLKLETQAQREEDIAEYNAERLADTSDALHDKHDTREPVKLNLTSRGKIKPRLMGDVEVDPYDDE